MKNFMIVALALTLGACTTTNNPIYTVKTESGEYVTQVPGWFMADYTNMKLCGDETHEGMCIFGAGTSVSPDLNLAIEKAKMVAKSEIADMIKGTMNKQSKQFITEVGKTQSKTVVTEVESAIVNSIENTPVRGYEVFKQDVVITNDGNYRAYVGLRLPMGKLNKMYEYTIEQAVDAYQSRDKSQHDSIWDDMLSSGVENASDSIQ
tara:strand:- start:615 stop:1232 length:618 start_codon:yes stop_codon:yes gene_type:complete